jgi:hypothetical protein
MRAFVLVLALSGCSAVGLSGGDGGADFAAPFCNPDERTCGPADVCNAPCASGCTDHGCFEPYVCTCFVDHLVCHAGRPLCDFDMARPLTD